MARFVLPSMTDLWCCKALGILRCLVFCCCWLMGGSALQAKAKVQFKLLSKTTVLVGKPFILKGIIQENDDLDEVILYYRPRGETTYRALSMTLYKGIRYRAKIPNSRVRLPALEYYIVGINIRKKTVPLVGSAQAPKSIKVANKSEAPVEVKEDKPIEFSSDDTVFSASRKEQRIQKAPGVVTVITEAEIKAAGFRDVVEMLRYVVGLDINQNGLSPDIGIRGINPRLGFGDKLVLLIDGHNMAWRQVNRNTLLIGIDMIKRVEVIRGPGSTLWGANALSGVINIITKTHHDLKGFAGTLGGSPLSRTYFVSLQGGREILGGLTFRGSFSLLRNEHSTLYAPILEFLRRGVHYTPADHVETNQYFYTHMTWKGLGLSLYQNHYEGTQPMGNFSIVGGDGTRFVGDRFIAKLSWVTLLGNWGTLLLWSSYDFYGFDRGAAYEANPFSRAKSSSTLNGNSNHFGLFEVDPKNIRVPKFKGYFPLCQMAAASSIPTSAQIPCIILETRETGQVCRLVKSPQETTTTLGEYPVPTTGTPTTPQFCLPSFNNGNYVRGLGGFDHRVSAGVQLSLELLRTLYMTAGLDFEYLYLLQVHSPEVWRALRLETPFYSNYHFSAFLQVHYSPLQMLEFTAGGRFDQDEVYGFVFTPRAAVILTPGLGFFVKLLYGNAFKAPSFIDLYYSRKNETYGNPNILPESVHTWELQAGWSHRRLMALSLGGFFSRFDKLIVYKFREKGKPLEGVQGISKEIKNKSFPDVLLPDGTQDYQQRGNSSVFYSYGFEAELRLFPVRGLNVRAGVGLFYGHEESETTETSSVSPLDFAARWMVTLQASYRYRFVQLAAGALFVGEKTVPKKRLAMPGYLPLADVNLDKSTVPSCRQLDPTTRELNCRVPNWDADQDPTVATPAYVHTYITLQFLELLGHLDLVFRVSNLLNLDIYDANDELLTPQKKLDFMMWVRLRY